MNDRTDLQTADDRAAATATADRRVPTERAEVPAQAAAQPAAMKNADSGDVELLPRDALDDFRTRWERVQVMFVDQPRDAVQQAHDLVDEVVARLTESFSKQREGLTGTWTRGEDVSTEDLRVALQRYRSFFDRLLSA